ITWRPGTLVLPALGSGRVPQSLPVRLEKREDVVLPRVPGVEKPEVAAAVQGRVTRAALGRWQIPCRLRDELRDLERLHEADFRAVDQEVGRVRGSGAERECPRASDCRCHCKNLPTHLYPPGWPPLRQRGALHGSTLEGGAHQRDGSRINIR